MLEIIDLTIHHTANTLFSGVCFSLNAGELIHIQGSNGAGKTTLLNILAGILLPDHGCMLLNGQSVHKNLLEYQNNICYVGHKTGVNQHLTPRTHCRFDLNINHATSEKWLRNLGLLACADIQCGQLSFGQRKLVGLLKLNNRCKNIWLLDEPFVGLDQQAIQILVLQLKEHLNSAGRVVLTSHQPIPETLTNYSRYAL